MTAILNIHYFTNTAYWYLWNCIILTYYLIHILQTSSKQKINLKTLANPVYYQSDKTNIPKLKRLLIQNIFKTQRVRVK